MTFQSHPLEICVNVSHDSFSNESSLVDKVLYGYLDTGWSETTMYSQIVCPVCRSWTDSHNFCIRCGSRLGYNQMTQAPLALPYQPRGPVVQQGLGYPQVQAPIQPYGPFANWNTPAQTPMQGLGYPQMRAPIQPYSPYASWNSPTTTPVQPQVYQPPAYQDSMPLAPAPYVHMQMMNQRMGLTNRPRF